MYFCISTKINFGSCFDKIMATLHEMFKKIYTMRANLEAGLSHNYSDINIPVDMLDRMLRSNI